MTLGPLIEREADGDAGRLKNLCGRVGHLIGLFPMQSALVAKRLGGTVKVS